VLRKLEDERSPLAYSTIDPAFAVNHSTNAAATLHFNCQPNATLIALATR